VIPMDFNWPEKVVTPVARLHHLDGYLHTLLETVSRVAARQYPDSLAKYLGGLRKFSKFLAYTAELLIVYVDYANSKRQDVDRVTALCQITVLRKIPEYNSYNSDLEFLAINFFVARLKAPHDIQIVNPVYGTL
jgi:hypothetical protein